MWEIAIGVGILFLMWEIRSLVWDIRLWNGKLR